METMRGSAVTRKSHHFGATRQKRRQLLCRGETTQTVDRVKPLIAYYVFCVAGRPVAGDSVAHVNRGLTQQTAVREIFTLRLLRRSRC